MSDFINNLLIDDLPTTVTIGGTEREINSNFRIALLFEMLMDDDTVPDDDKGLAAIQLFYNQMPSDEKEVEEMIRKMLWFYQCGKEPNEYMKRKEQKKKKSGYNPKNDRVYDFNYDDDYIYAAFIQQYGINLNSVEYMHWWEFKALFKSLTNETEFVKIMEFRGMDISSDLSSEQKSYYKKMKQIYALPVPKAESERLNSIEAALMGNGNLTGLL